MGSGPGVRTWVGTHLRGPGDKILRDSYPHITALLATAGMLWYAEKMTLIIWYSEV